MVRRSRVRKISDHALLFMADFALTLKTAAHLGPCDLIFTSPPYADARTYNANVNFNMEDYSRLGDYAFQALRPGGQMLMVIDAPVRKWRKGIGTERGFHPWKVMIDWAERVGFRVPDRLCYQRHGAPGAYTGRFRNDWEPLLWFQRPGGEHTFNKRQIASRAKYNTAGTGGMRTKEGTIRHRPEGRVNTGWAAENSKRHRGTFWEYGPTGHGHDSKATKEAKHPAKFPLRLAEDVVNCFSNPGDLVCDPFVGSGTTLAASLLNKRRFIGGDLHARRDGTPWVDVATKRTIEELRYRKRGA